MFNLSMKMFAIKSYLQALRKLRFLPGILARLVPFSKVGLPQFPGWVYYTAGNRISSLARDGNIIWVGAWGGLIAFDRTTGIQTCCNHANSGLPDNSVYSLAVDPSGTKWVGTSQRGLAKFDGTTWTVYNTSNSGIPSNNVNFIAADCSGKIWFSSSPIKRLLLMNLEINGSQPITGWQNFMKEGSTVL